ncbi:putative GIY-YIG superfamily endonuclease [Bradyrhizobium sp. JR7.2]
MGSTAAPTLSVIASAAKQSRVFSQRHGCKLLVWYELHATMTDAIVREKQIKGGSRAKKLALIESANPDWTDLYETLI